MATVAIKSCKQNDYRSERIKWERIKDMHSCEFYSKFLLSSISHSFMNTKKDQKYYIQGHYIEQENLVVFHINEMNAFQEGDFE